MIELWSGDWFIAEINNISEILKFEDCNITEIIFKGSPTSVIWSKKDGWSEAC